ncbi:hypothetical protein BN2476_110254 [Paraburkholderia piptadeniae]|uniref:Uncharacterized protein n=1 Tax=Paraburkholderia piptadeniae TaxID=1701573 RepID=A0A1N7RQN9_9BURK|nr:hypothetical protein BN2476_110254 [Paraburkholderia piptadeniae]
MQSTLDPLVRANYKDRFGAAVGYLTADPTSIKLARRRRSQRSSQDTSWGNR